jgi:hypothetical protein
MDKTDKQHERKRSLRLVEKYENDDYSRMAGPDYSDQPFEIGEVEEEFLHSPHSDKKNIRLRPEGNWSHPGVSGKTDEGETYLNEREYKEQTNFVGYGPKGYQRSDDRIYEEVCETLMRNPHVDATNIGVKVEKGIVHLSGKVESRHMKKVAELIIEDLPGVQDVRNELTIFKGDRVKSGPDAATKKDLGLY